MSRDYKPASSPSPSSGGSKGSPFIVGLLVGLLVGVGITVALTMFIKGTENPFTDKQFNRTEQEISIEKQIAENAQKNAKKSTTTETTETVETPPKQDNQFDFYTILPETESTVTEQEVKDSALIKKDSYFIQVGAFPDETDADNMKAKLALQGFEAVVQTATIPEKGVWHRVRVGPLTDIDQINKTRTDLTTAGFNTDLIKVHTETKPE
jgi:cell division protein FtsN